MVKILEFQKSAVRKSGVRNTRSTLIVIPQPQFSIDYPEQWSMEQWYTLAFGLLSQIWH